MSGISEWGERIVNGYWSMVNEETVVLRPSFLLSVLVGVGNGRV